MIRQLSLLFGSKTKAQEIVFLTHGLKPVVRQGYYAEEIPKVEKFCKEQGIFLVKSRFKVLLADETDYSNKGIRIMEEDKRRGMYFVYVSKNEQKAWLAAYYELMNNHYDLGLVLGYPQCCVNFFLDNVSQKNYNPLLLPTNYLTNLTQRENDLVLLSHFPCRSDCAESLKLAKKYLDVLLKLDRERAEEIVKKLRQF